MNPNRNRHDTANTASPSPQDHRDHRRRLLQAVTAAGIGGAAMLPTQWSRPVVDSVLLPAHAQATPTIAQPACAITCTRVVTESFTFTPVFIVATAFSEREVCMSENGQVTSSSTSASGNEFSAFSDPSMTMGTYATLATLTTLFIATTNTQQVGATNLSRETVFQQPCQ